MLRQLARLTNSSLSQRAASSAALISSSTSSSSLFSSTSAATAASGSVEKVDRLIIGGGPVGASTAYFLAENEKASGERIVLVHDPTDKGAHEDWSRLARLSFDGPEDEFTLSKHAIDLLDMLDEIRSYQSGAPVVPIRPGMVFLASPGTPMAKACARGEGFGDDTFVRRTPDELDALYPGNHFRLPAETLVWTHDTGYCVSPLELVDTARGLAKATGAEIVHGRATLDVAEPESGKMLVRVGERVFESNSVFLMAGARNKEIVAQSVARDPERNAELATPELDDLYISAISTVRYTHKNVPSKTDGVVVQPITLGQLDIPDLIGFQANFSVVAEEDGDVYKMRLSGDVGSETIPNVAGLHDPALTTRDAEMAETYRKFFGPLFPHLDAENPLDFNRCITYRNHRQGLSGTSLVEKNVGGSGSLITTAGCFGVGVKFGPALGQAAAAHVYGDEVEEGMNVFPSGDATIAFEGGELIERAY